MGIAGRVRFLGFVNQSGLPETYCASDVLVLPSSYEPFGVVVNEAMLCGCSVIVSDCVGAGFDLVREGRTGFIYPCGNISLHPTGILATALRDQTKLAELGRAAVLRMETWSPRENIDSLVMAVGRAVQLRSRSTDRK